MHKILEFSATCNARAMAQQEHAARMTKAAIQGVRFGKRTNRKAGQQLANLVREPAFDRSARRA